MLKSPPLTWDKKLNLSVSAAQDKELNKLLSLTDKTSLLLSAMNHATETNKAPKATTRWG